MKQPEIILREAREAKSLTQSDLANKVSLSLRQIQNYEKGKFPKFKNEKIKEIDSLLGTKVYEIIYEQKSELKLISKNDAKPVNSDDYEMYPYVSVKSYAGYLLGYEDAEYLEDMPTKLLPREYEKGNYLVFEVAGDSMDDGTDRAIKEGDLILCKELDQIHWRTPLYSGKYIFVFVTNEGITVKKVTSHNPETGEIILHSVNPIYSDYSINIRDVYQIFYFKKLVERKSNQFT